MAKEEKLDGVERVCRDLGDCRDYHDAFVAKLQKNYDAYKAKLKVNSDAAQWTSKLHPPWINHIVETTVASLVDDKLAYRVKAKARFYDEGEYELARAGAKAHEILQQNQLSQDRFSEIQRPLALQALIAGISVAKTYWKRDIVPRKRLEVVHKPIEGGFGLTVPTLEETEKVEPAYEGPTTEVVDVRDFFWHEAAVSSERSRFFIHRIWMTWAEMKDLEKQGLFKNVDKVEKDERSTREPPESESDDSMRNRTRDMVEVLEHWDNERRVVTWVAEQKVVLRQKPYPFWHGKHPFTICSTQPHPFVLNSISVVEKLDHLQLALWDLTNQRLDNVRLLNNVVTCVSSDVEDVNAFSYEPGARWLMDRPDQVVPIKVDPIPAEISLGAESGIKQDMQNLAGSQPFTSTSEADNIGAGTATEAALVSAIGQSATKQMKTQLNYAYERIGQMRLELNQQFVRKPIYVEMIGLDNAQELATIVPEMLQGDFTFDISPMNESLMRNERRAEANAVTQILFQAAPVAAAMGAPLNAKAILEDLLEAYDIENKERYFSALPQQAAGAGPGAPGPPGQGQDGQPQGVTGPGSIDPAVSPSNQASVSPQTMMSRNMSLQGAGAGGAVQ